MAETSVSRTKRTNSGVTLIELMIVVVIIGIIAAIAYPSYSKYMQQTRRSDGQIALMKAAAAQEKFYTDCGYYASTLTGGRTCGAAAGNGVLGLTSANSDSGYYTLANPVAGAIDTAVCNAISCGYTITATPTGAQAGNGALRIDSTGKKQWDKAGNNTFGYVWTDK